MDARKNLLAHLALFRQEGLAGVFFEMDLGLPWHAEFTAPLLDTGFSPRLVIPYGGDGDILVFQAEEGHP
jgi:hypothetical protein